MNRDIKFRAWDKTGKRFLNGFYLNMGRCKDKTEIGIWNHDESEIEFGEYPQLVLSEYTGLKDKNGKEIYEGDIVRFETGTYRQVIYQPPCFILKKRKADRTWTEFVLAYTENQLEAVIGNIYENPELTKEALNAQHE